MLGHTKAAWQQERLGGAGRGRARGRRVLALAPFVYDVPQTALAQPERPRPQLTRRVRNVLNTEGESFLPFGPSVLLFRRVTPHIPTPVLAQDSHVSALFFPSDLMTVDPRGAKVKGRPSCSPAGVHHSPARSANLSPLLALTPLPWSRTYHRVTVITNTPAK